MSAQIETRPLPATIADLSIDEALEALASVEAAGDRVRAELEQIMRDRTDLRTQIGLLMEQQGAYFRLYQAQARNAAVLLESNENL